MSSVDKNKIGIEINNDGERIFVLVHHDGSRNPLPLVFDQNSAPQFLMAFLKNMQEIEKPNHIEKLFQEKPVSKTLMKKSGQNFDDFMHDINNAIKEASASVKNSK